MRGGGSGRRADVCTCRTVRGSDGGAVARRAGACRMEGVGRWSGGDGQLQAHAGTVDDFFAETLGVAGGSARYVGSGVQVTHTAFVASLYVRTAFDVATPFVVSRIPTCMVTHGHVVAALLEEMKDVWGSASKTTRQSFVLHDAQGRAAWRGQVAEYVL